MVGLGSNFLHVYSFLQNPTVVLEETKCRVEGHLDRIGYYLSILAKKTDIVIEGAPRSANSFALRALRTAQPRKMSAAHHLHVSCQILKAVQWNRPTVLLIRNPVDVVASWIVRQPSLNARVCMFYYYHYYNSLKKCLDKVVIAPFDVVTSDFGRVIKAVNAKYGTNFEVFDHTSDAQSEIFLDRIRAYERRGLSPLGVTVPLLEKDRLKREIIPQIKNLPISQKAMEIYNHIVSRSEFLKN